ncbi:DoxX family protein [Alkalicoccobacillus porphyridii]|uniref:DoxX family membrane protein n=1 Tax=Alkalicoccobacillus porphyridii TaxID=2597270 RepID=A0A553ZVI3_9BACI|nr:hypothetical protein [Alkalicoccobacillus porphyridii]TSB45467.1 hypothetical protein FN960_16165 [Alkalicoccobacillus porphyridii]
MVRLILLYAFALLFIVAGIAHFTLDDGFARMFPEWVPFKYPIVYITGVMEWILAIMLLIKRTRRVAGILTAIYLVAVFPANIYMAIAEIPAPWETYTDPLILWIRFLFQPLLICWVLFVSKKA